MCSRAQNPAKKFTMHCSKLNKHGKIRILVRSQEKYFRDKQTNKKELKNISKKLVEKFFLNCTFFSKNLFKFAIFFLIKLTFYYFQKWQLFPHTTPTFLVIGYRRMKSCWQSITSICHHQLHVAQSTCKIMKRRAPLTGWNSRRRVYSYNFQFFSIPIWMSRKKTLFMPKLKATFREKLNYVLGNIISHT